MTRASVAIAALAAGALAAASASVPVGDSDVYWHLANARETLAHGLLRHDAFSWTAIGAPLGTDQWLGEIALYTGYALGGWLGVLAVRTVAVAGLVFAMAAAALARRPAAPALSIAVALPAILLSRFLWTDRPELFGAVSFALLVLLVQLPGDAPLIALAPLLVIWANVHGSFALGSALVLLIAARGILREPRRRRAFAVAMVAAALSFVLTPAGTGTIVTPGVHLWEPPREIQEWALPDLSTPAGALWAIVLGLVLATAAMTAGARATDVVLIVPTALLSLTAVRHTPLLAIAATPYLAERLPIAARAVARLVVGASPAAPTPVRGPAPRASAALAIAGAAMLLMGIATAPREPDESGFPVDAIDALPHGPGLLANYDWGGWLIWRAPATPVFVDGRLAPYRGDVLRDYRTVLEARPGWREIIARRGVRWILVRPGDPVAVRAVELGWRPIAAGRSFVLIAVGDPVTSGPP